MIPAQSRKNSGFVSLVVIVALVALAGVGFYLYQKGAITIPGLSPSATFEPRVNPEPTSGYAVSAATVNPGSKVSVDTVQLATDGYVVVLLDNGKDTVLGKSILLTAGSHNNVEVKLSRALKDGDVILIRLQDKSGKDIVNESNVKIELMKNVGQIMTHYANEY